MPKFIKIPVEIEAEQYTEYGKLVKGMCNSKDCFTSGNDEPHVHTIHNNQIVNLEVGDWIIPEPDGIHFYPCKPEIFKDTYKKIENQTGNPVKIMHKINQADFNVTNQSTRSCRKIKNNQIRGMEMYVMGDFEKWYKQCSNCGYDPGKSTNDKCWKCGRKLQRDFSKRALKPVFSEGICEDGAAILKDGVPMKITEILKILNNKK